MRWCSTDEVDIVRTTVSDLNVGGKLTAVWWPGEADLFGDRTFSYCRMRAIQPSWSVCSTMVFRNTRGGHFSSSVALETEPARTERLVTIKVCCINRNVGGFSVRTGQILVALAFYKIQEKNDVSRQLSFYFGTLRWRNYKECLSGNNVCGLYFEDNIWQQLITKRQACCSHIT